MYTQFSRFVSDTPNIPLSRVSIPKLPTLLFFSFNIRKYMGFGIKSSV